MRRLATIWLGFALVATLAGDLAGAERLFAESAAPREPLPPAACVRMLRSARIAHIAGDTAAELESLHAAAKAFPGEIAPIYALLAYDRDHGLPHEERPRLEAELERTLADLDRPLPTSILRQVARDPETSIELIRQIETNLEKRVPADGGDAPDSLLAFQAELQHRLGRDQDAARTLGRLWRRTGDEATAWNLFRLDLELERWPEALEILEKHEDLQEGLWSTHLHLLARAGRTDEALALVDRYLQKLDADAEDGASDATGEDTAALDVNDGADSYANTAAVRTIEDLAWSFRDAGDDAEAEKLFRRALARKPDDPHLEAILLHLYSSGEERQAQAEEVARAWKEERDPQALLDEGTQRLAAGDAEGAVDLLARAAPQFPRTEAPWFNLGMAAYRLESWTQVDTALQRAAELNPERAASFFFRGVALTHLDRCGDAVAALEKALELDPGRTQAHYYLAECYRTLGRPDLAERHRKLYEAASSG